jgi:putative ABC transport system substrate-binding protein
MKRREFITLLGGAVTWPLIARAQQPERMRRVGVLMGIANDAEGQARVNAFQQGLQELGWTANRNIRIDYVWASGAVDMQPHVRDLMRSAPEVVLTTNMTATLALRQQTGTIPIVFATVSDPVGAGLVKSLARPGGNVTGFTNFEFSMGGKWIEILKDFDLRLMRVLVISNPQTAPYAPLYLQLVEAAAPSSGIEVVPASVRNVDELTSTITAFASKPNGALIVLPDIFTGTNREVIILLAAKHRLPTVYPFSFFPKAGGLISYGIDQLDIFRRAASYIDRILKGANVGDLPIQQPTKFELVINLKTAKALGLTIPPALLTRADVVIE